jgi:hypothetical protein
LKSKFKPNFLKKDIKIEGKALFEIDTKNFSLSSTYWCVKTLGRKCSDYLKFRCGINKTSPKIVPLKIELGCFWIIHFKENSLTTFITSTLNIKEMQDHTYYFSF